MGRSAQPSKKVVNMGHPAQPSKKVVENHKRSLPALSHIGGRVIYTIVAWFVLALDVSPTSFFVSLFLFVLPVLMDCVHFGYEGWSIKKIIQIETSICIIWATFAILGLVGIFVVVPNDGVLCIVTSDKFIGFTTPMISVSHIWGFLGSIVGITVADLMCRRR